jgi:hypothetical protein
MALSPFYGWSEPDNSSLVKNGAADIRTLGDAIDTSLWNVGFGQAGKNKVINGDFGIWQRGTTFTAPSLFTYTADRWQTVCNGTVGGLVISQQAFTPGTAPVAGYEGNFFLRQVVTSQSGGSVQALATRLEDVRTFAGQTATLSFWAKADSAKTWSSRLTQNFGSGGSGEVSVSGSSLSVTTSWTRFTQTFTVPSVSGKTIGAGSYLYIIIDGAINTAQTMDIWGVQLEYGSKATPFETATGTIQGELDACQRYYFRINSGNAFGNLANSGYTATTTSINSFIQYPVTMRTIPTAIDSSTVGWIDVASATGTASSPSFAAAGVNNANIAWTTTGATANRFCWFRDYAGAGVGYIGLSAEL